jgi:hypothetical protein
MEAQNTVLHAVIQRFPNQTQEIIRLFVEDDSFREICEDYVICANALKKMGKSPAERNHMLEDYQSTLGELEGELLELLLSKKTSK